MIVVRRIATAVLARSPRVDGGARLEERAAWPSPFLRTALAETSPAAVPRIVRLSVVAARRGTSAAAHLALPAGVRSNVGMSMPTAVPLNVGLHITSHSFGRATRAKQFQRYVSA